MQKNRSNTLYQLFFIVLIYIEYPLILFLGIDGLNKMDVYHIVFILAFIIYTLFPKVINKYPIILLVYSDVFVLIKYMYTLITHTNTPAQWLLYVGFSSDYDPNIDKEYFRYPPRLDQWCVVVLSLILYRRQITLGAHDEEKFNKYRVESENTIKQRLPWLYRIYIYLEILYNHTIVILAFTIFLLTLAYIQSSIINAVSQTLVLILLLIYLSSGIY